MHRHMYVCMHTHAHTHTPSILLQKLYCLYLYVQQSTCCFFFSLFVFVCSFKSFSCDAGNSTVAVVWVSRVTAPSFFVYSKHFELRLLCFCLWLCFSMNAFTMSRLFYKDMICSVMWWWSYSACSSWGHYIFPNVFVWNQSITSFKKGWISMLLLCILHHFCNI